jgi:hypothetical protein
MQYGKYSWIAAMSLSNLVQLKEYGLRRGEIPFSRRIEK